MAKSVLLVIKFMKYGIVQFLLYRYLEESLNCPYISNIHRWFLICMNNRHIHLFYFLIKQKLSFLHPNHCQYFYTPHPSIQKVLIKNLLKRFWTCDVTEIGSNVRAYVNNYPLPPDFAYFNTTVVLRWWWRYLWRHNSRTNLKMTSYLRTWNQQVSIC